MVKTAKLSPIYNDALLQGYVQDYIAPQQEIKNLIQQVKSKVSDNVLLQYDNWTYHIKWYMLPSAVQRAREYAYNNLDTTVGVGGNLGMDSSDTPYGYDKDDIYHIPENEKVIILETGVTAQYDLESLTYKTCYSDNRLSGYCHMTEMTMVVKEPLGCSLNDKIDVVSRALGWNDKINMPFYIEIYFEGYNPSSGMPERITPVFMYKVCVTGCKTNVKHNGCTYTYKLVPYNQYGFQKDNFVVKNIGKLGDKTTGNNIYEFFNDFEEKLNKEFFEIGDNEKLKKYYQSYGGTRYEFVLDEDVSSAQLDYWSTFWRKTQALVGAQPNPSNTILDVVRMIWSKVLDTKYDDTELRVFSKQVIIGYREDGGQLEKVYYFIVPIRKPFNSHYIGKFSKTKSNAKTYNNYGEYVNYLYRCGLLDKSYEYMFSGKDVNVLNFDFNLNNLWFLKSAREQVKTQKYNEFDTPKDQLGNTIFDPELYGGKIDASIIQIESARAYAKIYGVGNYSAISSVKYLDDVDKLIPDYDRLLYLNYKVVPERAENDADTDENQKDDSDDAKPMLRKTALEECHAAGEMTNIKFDILGDPYWMGDDTFDNTLSNIRSFVYGNHHITFTVKTPVGQDETTGEITNYGTSQSITGFYVVIGIEHKFSKGKFTQTIDANLDPMLAIRSDYEDIDTSANQVNIFSQFNTETQNYTPINRPSLSALTSQYNQSFYNVKDIIKEEVSPYKNMSVWNR